MPNKWLTICWIGRFAQFTACAFVHLQASLPHIVIAYAACGNATTVQQLLVSLTSLFYMANSRSHVYDVIVVTDGAVSRQHIAPFQSR